MAEGPTNRPTGTTTGNIDALQVESVSPRNHDANNSGLTFKNASSISFIVSLFSYFWYIIPIMQMVGGGIFFEDANKEVDEAGDYWEDDSEKQYNKEMSYYKPFLIASVIFIIATIIQIYIWFSMIIYGKMGEIYLKLCIGNVVLSFAGFICQVIALANLEDDRVGDINTKNKKNDQLDKISYNEMMYGGFLLMYALYNIYFTSLLFPIIGQNQFIRLTISCLLLIVHCGAYLPNFIDDSNDYEDSAKEYDDIADEIDTSSYYYDESDVDYYNARADYLRKISGNYAMGAVGLVTIIVGCIIIIVINIYTFMNDKEIKSISQLSLLHVKRGYLGCVAILSIGLIIYLISLCLIYFFIIGVYYTFANVGFYILFSSIVVIVDIVATYKSGVQ